MVATVKNSGNNKLARSVGTGLPTFANQWIESLLADRAKSTIKRYENVARGFLGWYEGVEGRPATASDFTPISLVGYRTYLQKQSKTATVNTHLTALRVWGAWLQQTGLTDENPASRLKLAKRQAQTAPKALTSNQVNALLREADRNGRYIKRDKALIMLLLQTGLRVGEAAALNIGDIEFGEKAGRVTVRAGKGNKTRVVPLNQSARQALANYLSESLNVEANLRVVAANWSKFPSTRPLWLSERGGPAARMTISALERVITRVMDTCRQRKLISNEATAYSLRHTFATRYLATHQGDLIGLSQLLGHSSINTTAIYARATQDEITQRVENIDLNAYK